MAKNLDKAIHFLHHTLAQPFSWGSSDCSLWAADVVFEMTGIDYAAPFRGRYDTKEGAAEALEDLGFSSVSEYLDSILIYYDDVACAERGDVVMRKFPKHGEALGICMGKNSLFKGESGTTAIPTRLCHRAWRVE